MRKLSIFALVVILAGALSVAGFAKNDTATADANFNVNSAISLSVQNGQVVEFGSVTPGESYSQKNATKLKVKANKNLSWSIEPSKSSGIAEAENALSVSLKNSSGTGKKSGIKVDYDLEVPDNMPSGNHTVTVTFTASTT